MAGFEAMTAHHTPEKLALKRAAGEVVRGVGGIEAAALHCRVGKSALSDYARPENDSFMPVDVLADLEPLARERAGWPHLTRELAAQQGFALVELPSAPASDGDHLRQLACLMREGGDVAGALHRAMADGRLCAQDRAECRRELWDVIECAVAFHAQLAEAEG